DNAGYHSQCHGGGWIGVAPERSIGPTHLSAKRPETRSPAILQYATGPLPLRAAPVHALQASGGCGSRLSTDQELGSELTAATRSYLYDRRVAPPEIGLSSPARSAPQSAPARSQSCLRPHGYRVATGRSLSNPWRS